MKIYVMTDSHLGHKKLLEYGERPEEYENLIVRGIHEIPADQDLLIHLGDVCIGNDEYNHNRLLIPIRSRFKKTVLVRGNHDNKSDAWYYKQGWDFVCRSFTAKYFGKTLLFTHKPLPMEFDYRTDLNIHGHLHGGGEKSHRIDDIPEYNPDFHIDAAPELWGYAPIRLEKFICL